MQSRLNTVLGLLMLALATSACGDKQVEPEQVLPVRAQVSQCPQPATPPAELMVRPVIMDFLSTSAGSPPSKPSSLTP
jgi:hypothetical protein